MSFLLRVLTDGRAPPMRAPEVDVSLRGGCNGCCRCYQGSCEQTQVNAHTFLGACAACHCWGSCDPGPTSPGERMVHLGCCNFMPASAAASSPSTSQLWLPYPSLSPNWESKWALSSRCFCPLLHGQGRRLRVAHMQRQGQSQSWTPGTMRPKKRKGNLSKQPQE